MIAEFLLVVVGAVGSVQAQSTAGNADTVAWLLRQHCSKCHTPASDEPRASRRWSDALNLAATAADADLIEPGDPEGSTLYAVPFYTKLGYKKTTGVRAAWSFEGTGLLYQPMKKVL